MKLISKMWQECFVSQPDVFVSPIFSLKFVYSHFVISKLKCQMQSLFIFCKKFCVTSKKCFRKFPSLLWKSLFLRCLRATRTSLNFETTCFSEVKDITFENFDNITPLTNAISKCYSIIPRQGEMKWNKVNIKG